MPPTGHTKTRLQNSTTNRRRRPPRSGPHVDRADARTRKRTRNSPPVEDAKIFHLQLDLHAMTLTLHSKATTKHHNIHGCCLSPSPLCRCGSLRCATSFFTPTTSIQRNSDNTNNKYFSPQINTRSIVVTMAHSHHGT